ncbi:GntP family permease [Streptomyces hirsutus]|uniref:GntP family permease n=1 Tax=Streptomyces hirsutus TaxID=35620 RepID=UPI0036445DF1
MTSSPAYLMTVAAIGIAVLLFLIIRVRVEPFVSLLLVSAVVAFAAGIPLAEIVPAMEDGVGRSLAHVAPIVGLGALLGKLLEVSGGARVLADRLLGWFGERRAPAALGLTGIIFGIPVFFDVGVLVIAPLVFAAAASGRKGMLWYALPAAGGLAIVHGLLPPHPGPVAASGLMGANIGLVILIGAVCTVPAYLVGFVYARWIARRIEVPVLQPALGATGRHEDAAALASPAAGASALGLGTVVTIIAVPIGLILVQTFSSLLIDGADNAFTKIAGFIGSPLIALLIGVLFAMVVLSSRYGWSRTNLTQVADSALRPVGMILLVVGAGGVFGSVLTASGIGKILAEGLAGSGLPLILLAFVIAYLLRLAQGSATVATVAAAGIVAGLVEKAGLPDGQVAALVVAISAGAISTSHVNDAGYWLVTRLFGIPEKDSLRSWTVMTTLMGFTSFAAVAGLSLLL